MEWVISVNDMLKDSNNITKLNYTLIPPGFQGDVRSVRVMQESLSKLIDSLGEQSAAAQSLSKVITTAEKLRNSPTHILYLLRDPNGKGGRGEVIGMLKVGRKHLFLFDEHDKVCEVEPLCVLDFFVLRDRQRHGYGQLLFDHMLEVCEVEPLCVLDFFVLRDRQRHGYGQLLFDHMLEDLGMTTAELAIDGPSAKMEQFLARHYGVQRLMKQNNNFAVAPQFFAKATDISKSGRSTPVVSAAVGRFAAPKPPSAIATVIHGGTSYYQESNGKTSGRATPDEPMPEPAAAPAPEPEPSPVAEPPAGGRRAAPELKPASERPSSLRVEPAAGAASPGPAAPSPAGAAPSPAGSTMSRRDSQLTDRGFFDVKFYHNKLW